MTKKCPFCSEEIQEEALKCRWCGEFLNAQAKPAPKWYTKGPALFIGFLILGPLILPLVWTNRNYSTNKKVVITVLVLLATLAIVKGFAVILQKMDPVYEYLKMG